MLVLPHEVNDDRLLRTVTEFKAKGMKYVRWLRTKREDLAS